MDESIDSGNTGANDAFWGDIMQRIGYAAGNRIVGAISPPKVDQSPVATTNIVQIPPAVSVSVSNMVVVGALLIGAYLIFRAK